MGVDKAFYKKGINRYIPFILFLAFLRPGLLQAQKAIDFTLKDLDGKPIRLSDYYGQKIILLDFWATWCLPCRKELPSLQHIYNKYKDKGLEILAVNVDSPDKMGRVKSFVNSYNYSFSVLLDGESKVVSLYNPQIILPYTVLIDKKATIKYVHQGYSLGDENYLEKKIIELLKPEKGARIKEFSYHLNEAFLSRNFADKNFINQVRRGRATQIINQLDLTLSKNGYLFGLRIDSNFEFSPLKKDQRLAKRYFELDKNYLNLRIGDFYHSLGRGLLFSLLKIFEKEGLEYVIDTTLEGGRIELNSSTLSAQLIGGWVARINSNLKDKLIGGRLGWDYNNFANLHFNYLYSNLEEGSKYGDKKVMMESISLDLPNISDRFNFYGEFALVNKESYYSKTKRNGHGVYLEGALFVKNFSFLLEFKDYKYLNFDYNRPPLLEPEELDILANQFDIDATDITGISARIDYNLAKYSTLFYGKIIYINDNPHHHLILGEYKRSIIHFLGGLEKKFKNTGYFNLGGGFRRENNSSYFFYSTFGRTFHLQFNFNYPLTSRLSFEVDGKYKDFKGKYLRIDDWRSYFSLHYSPFWILSFYFERSNEPEVLFFGKKENWFAFQAEFKVIQSGSLRLLLGSTKGGAKCSGGVCKYFPPFKGLRLAVIFKF